MRDRVGSYIDMDPRALQITTFHSFCARLLRSEANHLGLSKSFTIYDTGESKSVVKVLMKRYGVNFKEQSPLDILYYIDNLKNLGYYPGRKGFEYDVEESDPLYGYYRDYEKELHTANAVDFGGLIVAVLNLFENFPEVLSRYQGRYKYVLVDEYQDTNRSQFELIDHLCKRHRNICVVGDEDQSIYSWRGADIRNILDFEEKFPEVELIKLEQNYRSSKKIIEAASSVIARNSMRKGKEMWTENSEGEDITIVECQNDIGEADYLAEKILEYLNDGVIYSDIAIFYRTNFQSRMIEEALRVNNIPYRVVGGVRFYERKEVKDILAYARVVINDKDSLAFSRIINTPTRGIGAVTLRKIEEEAIRTSSSLWETVSQYVANPEKYKHLSFSARVRSSFVEFVTLINELKYLCEAKELPSVIYEKMLHESGYWKSFGPEKGYEALARRENLQELFSAIKQFEKESEYPSLEKFLETITLDSAAEDNDELKSRGEVSLMTIHGAKGLEFPYVFLTGAEEHIFPSYRSIDEGEVGLEEERRLFYVAMTRAMKKLNIMFAQARIIFGSLKFNGPSRFIQEISPKYYNWKKVKNGSRYGKNNGWNDDDEYSQESGYADDDVVIQIADNKRSSYQAYTFDKGSSVSHAIYGQGKVLSCEGSKQSEKVVIKFLDGSKKKFLVKFAPLTKV
jgi:DNA helicase-2/ATP-dependent DNA helicase PcrA